AENGGCTVFGCESAPTDVPKIAVGSFDIATSAPPSLFSPELQSTRTLYFVNRSGDQFGPYSLTELQQYVAERRLAGTDLAWSEGMPQWVFVCDVIGNLRQPNSHSAATDNRGRAHLTNRRGMPGQAIQTGDPLHARIRFGRGLFFLSLIGLSLVAG